MFIHQFTCDDVACCVSLEDVFQKKTFKNQYFAALVDLFPEMLPARSRKLTTVILLDPLSLNLRSSFRSV